MGHVRTEVTVTLAPPAAVANRPTDVTEVYRAHGDFVWATLQRMGVRDADLHDQLQEVFIVVHRRLGDFEGRSALTTWLFGICLRVVAGYRRKLARRKESTVESLPELQDDADSGDPEGTASRNEARHRLAQVLDAMDVDKRVVLVMFEVEDLSCEEIARTIGIPVGTVYSRLHAARAQFEKVRRAAEARDATRGER
jgi:RNA polymerase sigma-70 factor (ECF subfamily)